MFEKILHKIVGIARFSLITFVLVALVAAGANALQLESAATAQPEAQAAQIVEPDPTITPDEESGPALVADDSDEPANDGMANNSRPWSGVEGCYWSATSLTYSGDSKRITNALALIQSTDSRCDHSDDRNLLSTSRGEVSASLSHQATLVGAKPSGTS